MNSLLWTGVKVDDEQEMIIIIKDRYLYDFNLQYNTCYKYILMAWYQYTLPQIEVNFKIKN